MKLKGAFLMVFITIATILSACEPLLVLDPQGPQAARQAHDIKLSIILMSFIVIAVFIALIIILFKYRASKQSPDYEPPEIEGHPWLEAILFGIPIIIVIYLSFVSVKSNYIVEATPKEYEDQAPLVIYAASSDWKWHFSYPEEDVETVNYLYIPAGRALEFKLYSYGPITSFWIPQLGGQKYAMADMLTTLHLAADNPGEMVGRNANFSGKGFAENRFNVTAMTHGEFDEWVEEVHDTAEVLTEEKFEELLEPGHLGQMTFRGTHLEFSPPPAPHSAHSVSPDEEHVIEDHSNH